MHDSAEHVSLVSLVWIKKLIYIIWIFIIIIESELATKKKSPQFNVTACMNQNQNVNQIGGNKLLLHVSLPFY